MFEQQPSATELLALAVEQLKVESDYAEDNKKSLAEAIAEINQGVIDYNELATKVEEQSTLINMQTETMAEQRNLLLLAEKLAHEKMALERTNVVQQQQIKKLQKQITDMKGPDSPSKMKALIKNQKAKAVERNGRIDTLTANNKGLRSDNKQLNEKLNSAVEKIRSLNKELAHNTGAGVYHKNNDHLIIWPEKTTMQRDDGSRFEGRSLLFMHNSGAARMVSFDPDTGQAMMCKSPAGGLRMTAETREFAQNWLFNVNEVQSGIVHDADMVAINHNVDLKPVEMIN